MAVMDESQNQVGKVAVSASRNAVPASKILSGRYRLMVYLVQIEGIAQNRDDAVVLIRIFAFTDLNIDRIAFLGPFIDRKLQHT
jgi:hypothetical protein